MIEHAHSVMDEGPVEDVWEEIQHLHEHGDMLEEQTFEDTLWANICDRGDLLEHEYMDADDEDEDMDAEDEDEYMDTDEGGDSILPDPNSEDLVWETIGIQDDEEPAGGASPEVQYYIDHLDEEVYEGAGQSLRRRLITRVSEKVDNNSTDEHFENQLRREYAELIHFQKKTNLRIPTSLHMVRKILGVKDLWEVEFHLCPCEGHCWAPMPPKLWLPPGADGADGMEYVCPLCEGSRFVATTQPNERIKVMPRMVSHGVGHLPLLVATSIVLNVYFTSPIHHFVSCRNVFILGSVMGFFSQISRALNLQKRYFMSLPGVPFAPNAVSAVLLNLLSCSPPAWFRPECIHPWILLEFR
uniref:Uncharacterized protein n=1 Tax=Dunaliella tertiolecta TaxID=3047 RepID=A0A7S3R3Z3_DUNTE|mmetsp:Transcript_17266/g.45219  ORF Transcript_17266/g.45219 Transcript_17266/m.45219 type:complete len:356 (+) Transcript_17266:303-1370(+)